MGGERLKPCPFCTSLSAATVKVQVEAEGYRAQLECGRCGAMGPAKVTEASRIAAWNTRAAALDDGWRPPAGWKLVPERATADMCAAALVELSDATVASPKSGAWDAVRAYRAMLAAAPPPPDRSEG